MRVIRGDYHFYSDPITKSRHWILNQGIITSAELAIRQIDKANALREENLKK